MRERRRVERDGVDRRIGPAIKLELREPDLNNERRRKQS